MSFLKEQIKDYIFYVYALFFNLGARLGVNENRVGLISMHNAHFTDGLGEMEAEFKYYALKNKTEFEFVKVQRSDLFGSKLGALKFLTLDAFRMGRAKYIFLNDNFMALGFCKPSEQTKIIQLWHGQGAFKKFGQSISVAPADRRREKAADNKLSFVACSSFGVKDIYAEAFGVDESKVLALGCPTSDYYFRKSELDRAKANVYEFYPELEGKRVILYAPTFRDNGSSILSNIDFSKLRDENTEIIVRLHPQVHGEEVVKNAFDLTDYDNVNELCMLADVLITDYSSICMDFVLQNKPVVFYAFDLNEYKGARDFYFDYESYVPGPIAKTSVELYEIIKSDSLKDMAKTDKYKEFRKFNFDEPNGLAASRILEEILK